MACERDGPSWEVTCCSMPHLVIIAIVVINSLFVFNAYPACRLLSVRDVYQYIAPFREFLNRGSPTIKPTVNGRRIRELGGCKSCRIVERHTDSGKGIGTVSATMQLKISLGGNVFDSKMDDVCMKKLISADPDPSGTYFGLGY